MTAKRRIPAVTLLLIVANLLAAFMLLVNPDLAYQFGFRSDEPSARTVVTSLFLHANVFHLLGNMVFLAAVGASVELATGAARFAGVYFAGGILGVLFHYLVTRNQVDPAPFIGASGCIASCAGYYTVRYTGLRVPLAPRVSVSVATITGTWVALQALGGFVHLGDRGGTAYWAHIGGFVTGVALSFIFQAPDLGQLRLGHEVLEEMNQRSPAAAVAAAKQHLLKHPGDPTGLQNLARAYALTDDAEAEAGVVVELIALSPDSERPPLLQRLLKLGHAAKLSTHRREKFAHEMSSSHPRLAADLLRTIVNGDSSDSQRPEAMLTLAGLLRAEEPKSADDLLEQLSREYPMHPCTAMARTKGWLI